MISLIETINYLRQIQRVFYEVNGGYYDNNEKIKNIFINKYSVDENKIMDYYNSIEKINCITEYQNPRQYKTIKMYTDLIDDIKDEILDVEKILSKPIPIWGTVNMFQFSAQILPPNENIGNIILISSGLMTYALLISKIVGMSLPIKNFQGKIGIEINEDLIISNVEKSPELELRFIDLMLACLLTGEAVRARQYMLNETINFMVTPIIVGFECFVIAHEYSHYLLGHLDKEIHNIRQLTLSDMHEIIHNWNDELEADTLGIKLAIRAVEKSGLLSDFGLLGIFLCLKSFELFERLNLIRNNEEKNTITFSETHPPAFSRIKNYMEIITAVDNNKYLILSINRLIDFFWNRMLEKLHEVGIDILLKEKSKFNENDHKKIQKILYNHYSVEL